MVKRSDTASAPPRARLGNVDFVVSLKACQGSEIEALQFDRGGCHTAMLPC